MSGIAQNTQLEEVYQTALETLGYQGPHYKNSRGKLRRVLKKAFQLGSGSVAIQPPATFIWLDHRGKKHLPQQMATPHLFYAIRMVWNHSVPTYFKIPGVLHRSDVPHWSKAYRIQALEVLGAELFSRDYKKELSADQLQQVSYMEMATRILKGNHSV